jgi:DNA-binding response OmpR family regulator
MATVLIVEDDFFLADELGQSLTEAGHTVAGKALGFEDAAEIAAASPPQVALVDYRLKGSRDGIAVAEYLRKLGTHIIYVTSEPDAVRLVDGLAEIVPKPYDMNELVRSVAHVVQSAERDH